jgi:hypothetical protein
MLRKIMKDLTVNALLTHDAIRQQQVVVMMFSDQNLERYLHCDPAKACQETSTA